MTVAEEDKITELSPDCLPWEQQPEEGNIPFYYFTRYLALGVFRSQIRLAHVLIEERKKEEATDKALQLRLTDELEGRTRAPNGSSKTLPESLSRLMAKYSANYMWQKRCTAFDAMQAEAERAKIQEDVKKMRRRHLAGARKMFAVARDKLKKRLETIPDENWTVEDIRKWMQDSIKLERLTLGEAETITETNQGMSNIDKLSLDQKKQLFEKLTGGEGPPANLDELSGGRPIVTKDDNAQDE